MTSDLAELPHLAELFQRLRLGGHLCAEDGPLYLALRADAAAYTRLFQALGFELVQHPRGVYYFQAEGRLGKEATQMAVFFFIWVEHWADQDLDIEVAAFAPEGHRHAELPHLGRESWRTCLAEAGVGTPAELLDVVRRLERYGFAETLDAERFRLRPPAWRFLDLCAELWAEAEQAQGEQAEGEEVAS